MKIKTETGHILCKTAMSYGQSKDISIYAIASVANELMAAGAVISGVDIKILAPAGVKKSRMHAMQRIAQQCCQDQGLPLHEIQGKQHIAVSQYVVEVTGTGIVKNPADMTWYRETMRAGQDIVLTKWVGMEGMLRIASEKKWELAERFAPIFLGQIKNYENAIFATHEIDVAKAEGVSVIRQVGEGGIFAALWELAKEAETGLAVDLRQLSIRQETIELCEYYRLNPYQLASTGTLLMVCDDGEAVADALRREDIEASVIGRLTDDNDKVIHNGAEVRYIDRPAPDELMKLFDGGYHERD